MYKISAGVVFVCIFALTHHSGISASASDLSPIQMAGEKQTVTITATGGIAEPPTTMSGNGGVAAAVASKPTDLFAIEEETNAAKVGSGGAGADGIEAIVSPASLMTRPDGLTDEMTEVEGAKRRVARSFFYTYPYYDPNLYNNNGYYPYYSNYYTTFYKTWSFGFPYYYGYPRVLYG